ncbi:MAG: response regulator [Rhodobacteraceae bacterium]|nr:response regulator [Paracoccaceae bacterium]
MRTNRIQSNDRSAASKQIRARVGVFSGSCAPVECSTLDQASKSGATGLKANGFSLMASWLAGGISTGCAQVIPCIRSRDRLLLRLPEDSEEHGSKLEPRTSAAPAKDVPSGAQTRPAAELEDVCSGLDILVVEDNKLNAAFMQQVLGRAGARVCVAENGAMALERMVQETFDIVFTDIQMPVMDGIQMLKAYKESGRKPCESPRFVACSGLAETEGPTDLHSFGFDAVLEKPISIKTIVNLLLSFDERRTASGDFGQVRSMPSERLDQTGVVKGKQACRRR